MSRLLFGPSALALGVSLALAGVILPASAGTITDGGGNFTVGIGADGELYDPGSGIGFRRTTDSFDPLSPGTPRDSWGLSAGASSVQADSQDFGSSGVTSVTSLLANSATVTTVTTLGLTVVQNYSFLASNILGIKISVANNGPTAVADVLFARNVDWDVAPTTFTENTVAPPMPGFSNVISSSYYGFEDPSPLVPPVYSASGGANATGDLGAGITLDLGTIGAYTQKVFTYFYAIGDGNLPATSTLFLAQLLGQTYGIITQSSENGQFPNTGQNYAMLGVGAVTTTVVPGPIAGAGLPALLAIGGFAAWRRRSGAMTS